MPLDPNALADALAASWLPGDDGPYPDSVSQSADAFSQVVANWFQSASVLGVPNVTAQVARPILMNIATPALSAQSPAASGALLANGVALYMTGQVFGPMVSSGPVATPLGQSVFTTVFSVLELDRDTRAQMMGLAIFIMAISTMAVGPALAGPIL